MQGDTGKVILWVAAIQDWRQLSAYCAKPSSPLLGLVPLFLVTKAPTGVPTFGGQLGAPEDGNGADLGSWDPTASSNICLLLSF